MSKWKPIETAPKDGTYVLGYGPCQGHPGYYITDIHYWNNGKNPCWTITFMHGHGAPTHWMPLPDPPKPDLSDKGDPRFQMFRAGKEARDDGLSLEHAPDVTEGEHRQIWINGWVGRDTELRRKS